MRKQYHFWQGDEEGLLDAWDVDRLVELSADLPVSDVELSEIGEIHSVYWFDEESDPPTVQQVAEHARLIRDADLSYPIILGPDGRVMDGMHRVARAIIEDRQTIKAVRFTELPEPDFRSCRPEELPYERPYPSTSTITNPDTASSPTSTSSSMR